MPMYQPYQPGEGAGNCMIESLWNSIAGIRDSWKNAEVAAHNVANVNTDGFKPPRAPVQSGGSEKPGAGDGGDRVEIGSRSGQVAGTEPPDVDLAKEMIDLIISERTHQANVKTTQVSDEMIRQLIDLKI